MVKRTIINPEKKACKVLNIFCHLPFIVTSSLFELEKSCLDHFVAILMRFNMSITRCEHYLESMQSNVGLLCRKSVKNDGKLERKCILMEGLEILIGI